MDVRVISTSGSADYFSDFVPEAGLLEVQAKYALDESDTTLEHVAMLAGRVQNSYGAALKEAAEAFSVVWLFAETIRLVDKTWDLFKAVCTEGCFSKVAKKAFVGLAFKVMNVAYFLIYSIQFFVKNLSARVLGFAIVLDIIDRLRTVFKNISFLSSFKENPKDAKEVRELKNLAWKKHAWELLKNTTRILMNIVALAGRTLSTPLLIISTICYQWAYRRSYVSEQKVIAGLADRGSRSMDSKGIKTLQLTKKD